MGCVIRKRIQVQPTRGPTVDRSLTYVVGSIPEAERRRLRGVVFRVATKVEALRLHRELHKLTKEAVAEGHVPEFLYGLDQRARSSADPGPTFKEFADDWYKTCVEGGGLRESQVESDKSILKNHIKLEYGLVEKNPVTKRSWMRIETTPEEGRAWWAPDDEAKAVATLMTWRDRDLLPYLALLTQLILGLRFSELRALEKRDLDLQVPGIWVRCSMARTKVATPKGKKARFHVVPRGLAEELRKWMLSTEGQLLFPDPRGGHLSNKVLNRWYRELSEEAGVPRITSHGARHTSGSSYAVMGAGQKMIATLLGHADTSSSERYTHVQVDATRTIVEARWAQLTDGGASR